MSQIEVALVDSMGNDDSIASAARVSFGKSAGNYTKEQNTRLLKYLAKHKHMSPFGHVFLSFHIKAPIFVARQLVKHKFLRWNEISRRYIDDEPEFYEPDWRGKAEDVKQGSVEYPDGVNGESTKPIEWIGVDVGTHEFNMEALSRYQWMIDIGIAPEQARIVLPQSTMTEWYWSGSLDAFTDMCSLRVKEDTQYESRLVAQQVYEELKNQFPVAAPLLVEGVY